MSRVATVQTLEGFLDAFNRHDLDAIMAYFADDCVFYMPRGAVRAAIVSPARTRCVRDSRSASPAFQTCIMARTATGRAATSAYPSGR